MGETTRSAGDVAAANTFSRGAATTNNARTYVLRGQLVAQPYPTRKRPAAPDSIYGKVNSILNPPNLDRISTYSRQHNVTAVTVQTAGTVHKKKVPYSMAAPRNRLNNPEKKRPPPFSSTLDLKNGGVLNSTVYPYRTISRTVQLPTTEPMEARTGCECAAQCTKPQGGRPSFALVAALTVLKTVGDQALLTLPTLPHTLFHSSFSFPGLSQGPTPSFAQPSQK
jgi:hypothetical protein